MSPRDVSTVEHNRAQLPNERRQLRGENCPKPNKIGESRTAVSSTVPATISPLRQIAAPCHSTYSDNRRASRVVSVSTFDCVAFFAMGIALRSQRLELPLE